MPITPAGVYRATITRVDGPFVWVRAPRLAATVDYGPLEIVETATTIAVGDRVVVAFLEGIPDQLIVIGRLATTGEG